ncbi:unnamed protein product, partial [Ceratitis capitata]
DSMKTSTILNAENLPRMKDINKRVTFSTSTPKEGDGDCDGAADAYNTFHAR